MKMIEEGEDMFGNCINREGKMIAYARSENLSEKHCEKCYFACF